MALFKGHPRDGRKRCDYVDRKIEHLRRVGLVTGKNTGFGMNGGAAPDHLVSEQKDNRKRYAQYRYREITQAHADHFRLAEAAE